MITVTLGTLLAELKKKGFTCELQENEGQIKSQIKIEGREYPFFARPINEGGLLQLVVFFPFLTTPKTTGDVARLLHLFNKDIDMPGFSLDEERNIIFYRVMIPSVGKKISSELLESYLNTLGTICQSFSPAIYAVATGAITYDAMLKRAKEMNKTS